MQNYNNGVSTDGLHNSTLRIDAERMVREAGYPEVSTTVLDPGELLRPHQHHSVTTHCIIEGTLAMWASNMPLLNSDYEYHKPGESITVPSNVMYAGRAGEQGCVFVEGHTALSPTTARHSFEHGDLLRTPDVACPHTSSIGLAMPDEGKVGETGFRYVPHRRLLADESKVRANGYPWVHMLSMDPDSSAQFGDDGCTTVCYVVSGSVHMDSSVFLNPETMPLYTAGQYVEVSTYRGRSALAGPAGCVLVLGYTNLTQTNVQALAQLGGLERVSGSVLQ